MARTQIAVDIVNLFKCDVIIETCVKLIEFLRKQPNILDDNSMDIDQDEKSIFDAQLYSPCQRILYNNLIFNFMNILTSKNSEFATKMKELKEESLMKYQPNFEKIIPAIQEYIKTSANQTRTQKAEDWGDSLTDCYDILNHLLDLIYPDMLIKVVEVLLSEDNKAEVRTGVLELLNKKLQLPEFFPNCDKSILSLLGK